jgi:redox-sensitive bicupin YhaK (pirin superfamily)
MTLLRLQNEANCLTVQHTKQNRGTQLLSRAETKLHLPRERFSASFNNEPVVSAPQLVVFERAGDSFLVTADAELSREAQGEARFLVLSGAPIEEPVVGYGPFVMNSEAEIRRAISDFNSGRFGRLPPGTIDRGAASA